MLSAIAEGLPDHAGWNRRVCFVGFSYADLSLPKQFDCVFDLSNPQRVEQAEILITAATQQFAKPVDLLDDGWKTICVIEFPGGVPTLVDEMPTVDSWYKSELKLGVCNDTAYPVVAASLAV